MFNYLKIVDKFYDFMLLLSCRVVSSVVVLKVSVKRNAICLS